MNNYERGEIDPQTLRTIREIEGKYCGWNRLPIAPAEAPIVDVSDHLLRKLLDLRADWKEKDDNDH